MFSLINKIIGKNKADIIVQCCGSLPLPVTEMLDLFANFSTRALCALQTPVREKKAL